MKTQKTIEFIQIGKRLQTTCLGTRFAGAAVRQEITAYFESIDEFVFDFTGIDAISGSFADECFAKLVDNFEFKDIKVKMTFFNASPFIRTTVSNAFKQRLSTRLRSSSPVDKIHRRRLLKTTI